MKSSIGFGPWLELEPLILRDFLDNSHFSQHPDVQKGNSSEHALILDFKNKALAFFEFYKINKMDFLEMRRFFGMYLGNWTDNNHFWIVAHRVFQVKCTSFKVLNQLEAPGMAESGTGTSFRPSMGII